MPVQQTTINQAVVLCDEKTRKQIQEMRLKLLGQQQPQSLPERAEVIDAEPEPEQ